VRANATYGDGLEAGNEVGLVSRYSTERRHTGVMGLFYILVAEHHQQQPAAGKPSGLCFSFPVSCEQASSL
jgi:hypothetical protein